MSKSLALVNGDLQIGQGRAYETVSGSAKLRQDLKLWILERIGTDPMTPTYGSRLDGGVENGQPVPSYIGQAMSAENLMRMRTEVIQLIERYQAMQYQKMRSETLKYSGATTISGDEVILSIDSVTAKTLEPTIAIIQVVLTTLNKSKISITIPVNPNA